MKLLPSTNTLSPYTTLFRSDDFAPNMSEADIPSFDPEDLPSLDTEDMPSLGPEDMPSLEDRKSTRLNSSHVAISYAVFCLKKKNKQKRLRHNTIQTGNRTKA